MNLIFPIFIYVGTGLCVRIYYIFKNEQISKIIVPIPIRTPKREVDFTVILEETQTPIVIKSLKSAFTKIK
jgi:hypothetical protein